MEKENEKLRNIQRKAKDSGNPELANLATKLAEKQTKPGKATNPVVSNMKKSGKPGKWPQKCKGEKEIFGMKKDQQIEQAPEESQEKTKGNGKTQSQSVYKAKKKWQDREYPSGNA